LLHVVDVVTFVLEADAHVGCAVRTNTNGFNPPKAPCPHHVLM